MLFDISRENPYTTLISNLGYSDRLCRPQWSKYIDIPMDTTPKKSYRECRIYSERFAENQKITRALLRLERTMNLLCH